MRHTTGQPISARRVPYLSLPMSAVALLLLAIAPAALAAQTIRGTVMEAPSGITIEAVDITLVDVAGRVVTRASSDSLGAFDLLISQAGMFRLRAVRIGYVTFTSDAFLVEDTSTVEADVFLGVNPIELPGIDVVTDAQTQRLDQVGFYRRRERGFGHFLTREDVLARHPEHVEDVFRGIPGVRVVDAGSPGTYDLIMRSGRSMIFRIQPGREDGPKTCYPSISIDGYVVWVGGVQPNDESQPRDVGKWGQLLHPNDIEAVEVYPGAGGLPAQVAGQVSPCGAVLIWTRG